ncbi:uracil-DNA glycosylase family protein [Arenibacter palladensis]|uniref:uracil-DNA glycosylase family protein n=1 Tax=Arenibacter palladensis TaxID=237373 RepID=UPI0026E36029|nr:uracil-DNA glycosylase family protein [Arenibacter palladensis]MDO6601540.1 uracil-DNA glycosylase family protein [Arenibacter palladensis]
MERLLSEIRSCQVCKSQLPLGPRPVVAAHPNARIVIIGQAPGTKVHQTGIPWDDPSGKQLRSWLNILDSVFYDESKIALIPMGFCYPGRGKGGDLPPRPECAPLWHNALLTSMPSLELIILIGTYSQKYYLGNTAKATLTETVKSYQEYLPKYFPLPHPSPRNRFWQSKNPWFGQEVVPVLQERVAHILELNRSST